MHLVPSSELRLVPSKTVKYSYILQQKWVPKEENEYFYDIYDEWRSIPIVEDVYG